MRTYKQAIKCLNSLQTNYQVIEAINKHNAKDRSQQLIPEMLNFLSQINLTPSDLDPLNAVHITGTKGKGSTAAFVQSILMQFKDLNVGLYTSPHLTSVRERIMLNGQPMSEEKFTNYFFEVYDMLETKPMYFRFLTLLSFHSMLKEKVNAAIYEVGIGGEYDSTNVLKTPAACGVTSLGIDHVQVLGSTIEEIAWNKSGIFKAGCPAYTVRQPEAALNVLRERAKEKKVSKFEVLDIHPVVANTNLGLAGEFQKKNATLACYLAAERLNIKLTPSELPQQFIDGLKTAKWPGRCQIIETESAKWFVDGAHTMESLDVAATWFAQAVDTSKPISLVFNQQKRDNVDELLVNLHRQLSELGIKIDNAYFTTNKTHDWGFEDDMISHNVSKESVDKLTVQNQLKKVWQKLEPNCHVEACASLEQVTNKAKGQVFATGSLLMVGGLLSRLTTSAQ